MTWGQLHENSTLCFLQYCAPYGFFICRMRNQFLCRQIIVQNGLPRSLCGIELMAYRSYVRSVMALTIFQLSFVYLERQPEWILPGIWLHLVSLLPYHKEGESWAVSYPHGNLPLWGIGRENNWNPVLLKNGKILDWYLVTQEGRKVIFTSSLLHCSPIPQGFVSCDPSHSLFGDQKGTFPLLLQWKSW